jgi:hypothetical protein
LKSLTHLFTGSVIPCSKGEKEELGRGRRGMREYHTGGGKMAREGGIMERVGERNKNNY